MYSGSMNDRMLQVRNVPEDVHTELKRRAAKNHLSLSDFVLAELRRLAYQPEIDVAFADVVRHGARVSVEDILAAKDECRR